MILVSNTDIKFKYPEKTGVCVRVQDTPFSEYGNILSYRNTR